MIGGLFIVTLGAAYLSEGGFSQQETPSVELLERELSQVKAVEFGASEYLFDEQDKEDEELSSDPAFQTFLRMDPTTVPDHVLLAVLLAGATQRNPVLVAQDIMVEADLDLRKIGKRGIYDRVDGVGAAGMARILASRELSRRVDVLTSTARGMVVDSPEKALKIARSLSRGPYEILSAMFFDRRQQLLGSRILTKGNDGFTIVDPKQVMQAALELDAHSVILVHQHPSGNASPSKGDRDVTNRVYKAGVIMGVKLLDHLVITPTKHYSFASNMEIPGTQGLGLGTTM